MNANNLYLIIAIIILIYLYFSVSIKSELYLQQEDNINKILIKINDDIISVDKNNIYNHLMLVKENLHTINKRNFTYDTDIANQIAYLAKLSCVDLNKFKIKNKYAQMIESVQDNRCDYRDISRSDINTKKTDLTLLISNVEITLLLIKQNSHGYIILTNLHNLLKFFSKISHGENYMPYNEIFDGSMELKQIAMPRSKLSTNYRHAALSQNITGGFGTEDYDGEDFVNEENNIIFQANVKPERRNKHEEYIDYNTQMFGTSGKMDISARESIKYFVPFCNIDKLKQENKNSKIFMDKSSRQSLRNDYC